MANALQQAVALHRQGDLVAAEQAYRRVRKKDADYGEALRLRGLIAQQQGDGATAFKLVQRAVQHNGTQAVCHHTLAEVCKANGWWQAAIKAYRRAWALAPERLETGAELAEALENAGYTGQAIAVLGQLLPDHPDAARLRTHVAVLYHEQGRLAEADDVIDAWQQQAPDDAPAWVAIGSAWASIYRPEPAAACYRRALALAPDHAEAHAGLGSALQLQGRMDDGSVEHEQALALQPALGWVYPALLANRNYHMGEQRLAGLTRQVGNIRLPEADRMHMHFALGTWHDRQGEHERAFEHFRRGNAMHARHEPFDADIFTARTQRIVRQFDSAFFAARSHFGNASERPVFIVGMPRSGTSLVEQIIASHPQAHGAGELKDINRMVRELPAVSASDDRYPDTVTALDETSTAALAQRYLDSLNARSADALRVTDKMPYNMIWLGLIALLFPRARVVYCRRNAMDNCLSCYFQDFQEGSRYCYDLEHLGFVYRQHERLMAHWRKHLPLAMLTVDYEQLVANQADETRRLIDFAGLPWDDRCLSFHTTRRNVHTASTWQVRQPMYRTSVERWRAYEPWLAPLQTSLEHTTGDPS